MTEQHAEILLQSSVSIAGHTAVAFFATHAVSCDKATVVWPAREATYSVANGGHTIYLSVHKLIPNLRNKEKYVIHNENLKLYESLGLKIIKIRRGIKFEERQI